jgi:hypothetical protein
VQANRVVTAFFLLVGQTNKITIESSQSKKSEQKLAQRMHPTNAPNSFFIFFKEILVAFSFGVPMLRVFL